MKKIILLAVCLVLGSFTLAGCSNNNEAFAQKEYTVNITQIEGISIDVRDRQIEVSVSEDEQIHIVYFENSKDAYDITVSNENVLMMISADNKDWTDYIGGKPSAANRKISVQIPDALLDTLMLSTTNEDISLSVLSVTESISISSNGGNINFGNLDVGNALYLTVKNGDISGTVVGSYDNFTIQTDIKKGESNLPDNKADGEKTLNVSSNNGDVDIEFNNHSVEKKISVENEKAEKQATAEMKSSSNSIKADTENSTESVKMEPEIVEVDWSKYFNGLNGTAVIYDTSNSQYTIHNYNLAVTRSSPCSTFKIISSLIALENEILEPEDSTRTWSGETFWNENWNKDIDFSEAFRNSCVWYYRQVIDDIGQDMLQKELNKLQYGNCDISDWEGRLNTNNNNRALTGFWIESSLMISPKEQVEVMERIFGKNSNYSEETQNELKQVMLVSDLNRADISIYGKTGMGKANGIVVDAWFTGFAESTTGRIYFCVRLGTTDGMNVSSTLAKEIAIKLVSDYCA